MSKCHRNTFMFLLWAQCWECEKSHAAKKINDDVVLLWNPPKLSHYFHFLLPRRLTGWTIPFNLYWTQNKQRHKDTFMFHPLWTQCWKCEKSHATNRTSIASNLCFYLLEAEFVGNYWLASTCPLKSYSWHN